MAGKKELFATIEYQKVKISKYESKLCDLVNAYKSLTKEKEALQASLAALSEKTPIETPGKVTVKQPEEEIGQDHDKTNLEAAKEVEHKEDGEICDLSSLQNQVATLASTVQTLSEEKNKLEISTTNERKRILEEKKKMEQQLKTETEEWNKARKDYETKLQDLRNKIIVFQHELEKEATNGVIMLREAESRLSKERSEKERLEKLLDETQEQNRQFALAIGTRSQEKKQHKQIIELQNELEQVRCRLKKAEQQCEDPPMLKILQDQMDQMKNHYMHAILQEQKRAECAENSVRKLSQAHEERVAALELSLAELSLTAATSDRSKQNFIETIHILKEKIAELSDENKALSTQEKGEASLYPRDVTGESDADELVKNFICLWNQITHLEESKATKLVRVEELLSNSEIIHNKCVKEYNKLEQQYQDLKVKFEKQNDKNVCRCGLREQTDELRERIRSQNASAHTTQATYEQQVAVLREELKELRRQYEHRGKQLEQDHKATVVNLEQQLTEHCQRSLITLQDRDEEIHRLTKEICELTKEAQIQPSTVAAALLAQVNVSGTDGPLLHHLEDLARKELEVSQLRKEKIYLEKSMRDVHMAMLEKQQALQEFIDDLREELERTKRNVSREGENLEYLKNVVLQYMTSVDGESRLLILNAIAAVLKFTPEETENVRKCLALWWWQAPTKTNSIAQRMARRSSASSSGATLANRGGTSSGAYHGRSSSSSKQTRTRISQ